MTSPFDLAYSREEWLFGDAPSEELERVIDGRSLSGVALDLGCGDGRDTMLLIGRGFHVTAIDTSAVALEKLRARVRGTSIEQRLTTVHGPVQDWAWQRGAFDLVVATTLLDHLTERDVASVSSQIVGSLRPGGILFAEVHTTDDPGYAGTGQPSEFAQQILHYFAHNELLDLFRRDMRVLFYWERLEVDLDHGDPHHHGFATLLGERSSSQ